MLNQLITFAGVIALVACGSTDATPELPEPEPEPATATATAGDATFRYDPSSGRCVNGAGATGYNDLDLKAIAATNVADCVDMSGQTLSRDAAAEWVRWKKVSFRGANLNGTQFPAYQGPMSNDFSGADIRGALDEYTRELSGTVDDHTKIDADCVRTDDEVRCRRR